MKNKKTAIELLQEQFTWMIEDGVDIGDAFHSIMEKFEQAKQMEEDQHFHTWYASLANDRREGNEPKTNFTKFYNETYKQRNNNE